MFKLLDKSNNLNVNCEVIDKLIHHIQYPNSVKLKTEIPQKISPGSMKFHGGSSEFLCNQGLYSHVWSKLWKCTHLGLGLGQEIINSFSLDCIDIL